MATVAIAAASLVSAGASAYSASQAGGKGGAGSGTTTSAPWITQTPYLENGFRNAETALGQAQAVPAYSGPFDAGSNTNLTGGWDRMANWSTGSGMTAGDNLSAAGTAGVNGMGQAVGNAQALYGAAGQDQTQNTMNRAAQFANSPYADGMVDASLRDVNRDLQLGLGQNNSNAMAHGGMNSTRAGVTQALLTQGAQDRAADVSSQLRGNLYNQGLNLASTQIQNGFGNQLSANAQQYNGAQLGGNLLTSGAGLQQSAIAAQVGVGDQQRTLANAGIQGSLAQDQYETNRMLDLVAKYQQIVGGQQYGGQQTRQNVYTGPSAVQAGLGGALQTVGLAKQLGIGSGNGSNGGSTWSASDYANYYNPFGSGGAQGTATNVANGNYDTGYGNYVSPAMASYYP